MQTDAQTKREAEKGDGSKTEQTGDRSGKSDGSTEGMGKKDGGITPPPPPQYRRFHASVTMSDPQRLGRDVAQIAQEVVQHLTRLAGAEVNITLEIQAELPEGASEKTVRDVTENCRTLKFDNYGFE